MYDGVCAVGRNGRIGKFDSVTFPYFPEINVGGIKIVQKLQPANTKR